MSCWTTTRAGGWLGLLLWLSLVATPQAVWSGESPFQVQGEVTKNQCRSCHGWRKPLLEQRPLGAPHAGLVVSHGKASIWCPACHVPEQPEWLQSLNSAGLPFAQVYESCGMCHGRILSAWRGGIHGKRLGRWSGERLIQSCTGCHAPHAPTMLPLVPRPPPHPPSRGSTHG